MLQKLVYSYEYLNDLEKSNETSLPNEGEFYSHLSPEDITEADYTQAKKRVSNDFEIKKNCEYDYLFVQSVKLLLHDVFNNFRNICFEIYGLDPAHFFLTRIIKAIFKKIKVKLDLLTDIDAPNCRKSY